MGLPESYFKNLYNHFYPPPPPQTPTEKLTSKLKTLGSVTYKRYFNSSMYSYYYESGEYECLKFQTKYKSDPIPAKINNSIDWDECIIGGSQALHAFTHIVEGDVDWEPNDIDIMTYIDEELMFKAKINRFEERMGSELKRLKYEWNDENSHINKDRYGDSPYFILSEHVYGVVDYEYRGTKIQFVGIGGQKVIGEKMKSECHTFDNRIEFLFSAVSDGPSGVSYRKEGDEYKFYLSMEKFVPYFMLKEMPENYCHASRLQKYIDRGYTFV